MSPALALAVVLAQAAAGGPAPSGEASLPLRELLPLLQPPARADGPTSVAVQRATLRGQAAEAGLWVTGHFQLEVATSQELAVVPLVDLGARAVLAPTEEAGGVALRQDGAWLSAVLPAGRHTVDFRALVPGRAVRVVAAPAVPPVPLLLDVDEQAFAVEGATLVREWGGPAVLPERGVYAVTTRALKPAAAVAASTKPPVEPRIVRAEARWVSTLEGQARHDVSLALAVDAPTPLAVEVPAGQRLVRARVNGAWVELPRTSGTLMLAVAPTSLGAGQATVELSLLQDFGVLHLSGTLTLEEPGLSWPAQLWRVQATLPAVFRYTRTGGSLAEAAEPTPATGDVPGTLLSYAQPLVGAQRPTLSLNYAVELEGRYFR